MVGIGIAQAKRPIAKDRPEGKKICMVRSFDFRQRGLITQGSRQYPYVLFISDMLKPSIRRTDFISRSQFP